MAFARRKNYYNLKKQKGRPGRDSPFQKSDI
jgi:hypothetical protein